MTASVTEQPADAGGGDGGTTSKGTAKTSEGGYSPRYTQAAERILEYIEKNSLSPGDRLPPERELGRILGFSYTVTREAVKVLSAVGRLSAQKGRGVYVSAEQTGLGGDAVAHYLPLDLADVTALLEFRRALEGELGELAAERATPTDMLAMEEALNEYDLALDHDDADASTQADAGFHQAVAEAAHSKFLRAALGTTQRLQHQTGFIGLERTLHQIHRRAGLEHQVIYDNIRRGDGPAARAAARTHVDHTLEDIHKEIQRRVFG